MSEITQDERGAYHHFYLYHDDGTPNAHMWWADDDATRWALRGHTEEADEDDPDTGVVVNVDLRIGGAAVSVRAHGADVNGALSKAVSALGCIRGANKPDGDQLEAFAVGLRRMIELAEETAAGHREPLTDTTGCDV